MAWPRVLVAGGSIGGLTTAVLLRDLGCEVDVYERAGAALEDRGAGIVVLPVTEKYFTNKETNSKRVSLDLTYWKYVNQKGMVISADPDHYRFSAWSTIYRGLLEAFGYHRYHFDHEMVGFDQLHDSVTLHLANGSSVEGDLLVCADGLASTGRTILLPEVKPAYAGYVAWRGTTPESELSDQAQADLADSMIYQVLDHSHILVYAIPDHEGRATPPNRVINFVWYRNFPMGGPFEALMTGRDGEQRSGTMPPGMIRHEHLAEMRATASRVLAPTLLEVVMGCPEPLIQAVFDLESPRMAFDRVCLIGDAAAGLRPHIAAGQAKACANAWALHDALAAARGDVPSALMGWEPGQLDLARQASARTKAMGNASQFEGTMVPGDPAWKFGLWAPGN